MGGGDVILIFSGEGSDGWGGGDDGGCSGGDGRWIRMWSWIWRWGWVHRFGERER